MPARQDSAGISVLSVPLGGTRGSRGSGALWGWWFRAPTNPGFAGHISPHSSEMLPAQPGEVQGEGWTVAGSIRRRRIERLPPVCPTCLWVSLSDTTAMLLAGWVGGGGELPLPGEMQQLSGFPQAPSCLELLLQPGGSGVFPAGPELPSQSEFQNPSRAVGSEQGRSCWPCCTHLGWFSALCSLILC